MIGERNKHLKEAKPTNISEEPESFLVGSLQPQVWQELTEVEILPRSSLHFS